MESNILKSAEEFLKVTFSDEICIFKKTTQSFVILWNFPQSDDCVRENIKSFEETMKYLSLFYIVVHLEDNDKEKLSLKLVTYYGKLLKHIVVCNIYEESEPIIEFIKSLKDSKLCPGSESFEYNSRNQESRIVSPCLVELPKLQNRVRSQKCKFLVTDGQVCEMCASMNKENIDMQEAHSKGSDAFSICNQCAFKTTNPRMLKTHNRINHSNKKPYMCQKCPFSSNRYLSVMKHINRSHEKTILEEEKGKEYNENDAATKPYTCEYVCRQCQFKTTKVGAITKHIRRSHEIKEPYRCEFCTKTFTNSGIMNVHVRSVHLKEKRYKCQDCSYESYVKHSVTKHIKYVHDRIRSYNCDICNFAATTKSVLESHTKRVHERLKPYSCDNCSFKAATNYHLKRHILSVHEKLKPHKCNQCEYRAAVSDNLSLHVRHVHDKIKEHKCEYCPYETTRKAKLVEHVNNSHNNTVIQVVENIHNIIEGQEGLQIPIEGIQLKFIEKRPSIS